MTTVTERTKSSRHDLPGLRLKPDAALSDAPQLDVLHVPGGFGQEALTEDAEVLARRRIATKLGIAVPATSGA